MHKLLWIVSAVTFLFAFGCNEPPTPDWGDDDDAADDDVADDDVADDDVADDDDTAGDDDDDTVGDDDDDDDDTDPMEPYNSPVVGDIHGLVRTPDGEPLEDVLVELEGIGTVLTDATGYYIFEDVEPDGLMHLTFRKYGYTSNYGKAELMGWEQRTVNARLLPVDTIANVAGAAGGDVDSDSLRLQFGPGSFVDAQGAPVNGAVQVTVTHVDPTGIELRAAPGDTRALDVDDIEVGLQSFGMAEVTLSANGQDVQIAPDAEAALEFLLPDPLPLEQAYLQPGDVIPSWSYDTNLERWIEEGTATVGWSTTDPGRLAAFTEVEHFTWWNIDWAYTLTCVQGDVTDVAGNPIEGAQVEAAGDSYSGVTQGTTDDAGHYVIWPVSAGSTIDLTAEVTIGGQSWSEQDGPYQTTSQVIPDGDIQGYKATISDILAQGFDLSGCQELPDIVIPTCVVAGEVTLMNQDIHNPLIPGQVSNNIGANAYFFEPDGTVETCLAVDPVDLPEDSCDVVSQEDSFVSLTTGRDPIGAGPIIQIEDLGHEVVLERTQREPGDIFYESTGNPNDMPVDTVYDVYAWGEQDGVPETDSAGAIDLGHRMDIQWPPTDEPLSITRGVPLQIDTNAQQDSWGMMVFLVPDDPAEDAVVCRCQDDGSFEVPGQYTSALPAGQVGMMVGRANADYAKLPTGYWARTIGMTAATMIGEVDN